MARGFGATYGVGVTDSVTTTLTTANSTRSFAFWWYCTSLATAPTSPFWTKSPAIDHDQFYTRAASSQLRFEREWTGATPARWTLPHSNITDNAWNHLTLTYDSSSTSNDPLIYVNGVSKAVTRAVAPVGTVVTSTDPFRLGNWGDSHASILGFLAEFAVWDVILDAQEALALGKGLSPICIRSASRVEYVQMVNDNVSLVLAPPTIVGTAVQPHAAVAYPRPRGAWGKSSPVVPIATQLGSGRWERPNDDDEVMRLVIEKYLEMAA